MPIKRIAWSCSWKCGHKVLVSKKAMQDHEDRCFWNPKIRACMTCGNFHKYSETVYDPHHGGDPGSSDWEAIINGCDHFDLKEALHHDCQMWVARKADYQEWG